MDQNINGLIECLNPFIMNTLRQLDHQVVGAARIVQTPFQQTASKDPVYKEFGSVCYRGIYYYSVNSERPYVALMKSKHVSLPLVKCSYELFVQAFMKGEFSPHDVSLQIPADYQEEIVNL